MLTKPAAAEAESEEDSEEVFSLRLPYFLTAKRFLLFSHRCRCPDSFSSSRPKNSAVCVFRYLGESMIVFFFVKFTVE